MPGSGCIGQGDERDRFFVADLPGDVISVQVRQADVQERHVQLVVTDHLQGRGPVVSRPGLRSPIPKKCSILRAASCCRPRSRRDDSRLSDRDESAVAGHAGSARVRSLDKSRGSLTRNSLPFPSPSLLASMVPP